MTDHFSIIVVGGGINGAGIAQCAAASGYSTLLVEQDQWGAGTSSKSSKLIHGGLRYLESGQIKMVYESLRERERLQDNAPELVKPNQFYIPLYQDSNIRPWKLFIGLSLYYLLSGFSQQSRFSVVPKKAWGELPLKKSGLKRVFCYTDCQTDDQQLTRAVVESARNLGATLLCPGRFINANTVNTGYEVHIETGGRRKQFTCDLLINASGAWVNELAINIQPPVPLLPIDLIQGSHLILSPQLSPRCYYLESANDGRAVFALPWEGKTLLGTTETPYRGKPENTHCLEQERSYLLSVVNHYFPDYKPVVQSTMAGLRVLPKAESSVHHRSREVVIVPDNPLKPCYIGVYGGKLTTYRSTAEKVIKLAAKTLGKGTRPPAYTANLRL